MPAWAVTVLEGDATTNGLLQAARGGGAVLSALVLASLGRFAFRGKLISFSAFSFPLVFSSLCPGTDYASFASDAGFDRHRSSAGYESLQCYSSDTGKRQRQGKSDEHLQPDPFRVYALLAVCLPE